MTSIKMNGIYKVTRTWIVKAKTIDEAIKNTKNWNHESVEVEKKYEISNKRQKKSYP